MDLLQLHPSFWTGEIVSYSSPRLSARTVRTAKSFVRWQALRRNKHYDVWASKAFCHRGEAFWRKPFFDRYFKDYPLKPGETFTRWWHRVIDGTRRRKTRAEIEREIQAKKRVWDKLPKGLPERWLPIPSNIEFPHPDVLRLLNTTGTELCVTPVPFDGMTKINVRGRRLWVDLSHALREILREILSYELLLRIENNEQRDQAKREGKAQLKEALRHRPRSTTAMRYRKRELKRTEEAPRLARIFFAWDLKQRGKSYSQIAAALWPIDYAEAVSKNRLKKDSASQSPLLQRAKDHVDGADRLIQRALSI